MNLSNHHITSAVFEFVKTIEFDLTFSDEHETTIRIELFRDTVNSDHWRCHAWETELFRVTPSFPRDGNNQPAHISNDIIQAERSHWIRSFNKRDFVADNVDAAMKLVIDEFKNYLKQVFG